MQKLQKILGIYLYLSISEHIFFVIIIVIFDDISGNILHQISRFVLVDCN